MRNDTAVSSVYMSFPLRLYGLALVVLCCTAARSTAEDGRPYPLVQKVGDRSTAELRLVPEAHFALIGAEGASLDSASQYFTITVDAADETKPPSLLGEYRLSEDQTLVFQPRYPLSRSVTYAMHLGSRLRDRLSPAQDDKVLFALPASPRSPPTKVEAVYPSAAELPENLLKFYIHFSAPMSRGQAYQRVQLFQDDQPVEEPFLELGEELWDTEQTRFTLFIHPGRIKRGLRPREESGPAVTAGKSYSLRIDSDWIDAAGNPLSASFEKSFVVTEADHQMVDPQRWQVRPPKAGRRDAVTIIFDEPLDRAMLMRVLQIIRLDGSTVPGEIQIDDRETQWRFIPQQAWQAGTYGVQVATNLEDLSGNSIARPFEVKMQDRAASQPTSTIVIEFAVP